MEHLGINDVPTPLQRKSTRLVSSICFAHVLVFMPQALEPIFSERSDPQKTARARFFKVLPIIGTSDPWYDSEKKIGLEIKEAFYQCVAKRTGMQDFTPADAYYIRDKSVSTHPAYMFQMTTRDMARFGLVYLDAGKWKGKQVLLLRGVEKSTHASEMVHIGEVPIGGYESLVDRVRRRSPWGSDTA